MFFLTQLIGWSFILIGSVWLLYMAFEESFGTLLLYLLIPFYSFYFILTRLSSTKHPVLFVIFGLLFISFGFLFQVGNEQGWQVFYTGLLGNP